MVMKLPLPAQCSVALVALVVAQRQNGRNRDFFNGIAAEWTARVTAYVAAGGDPAQVPTWPQIMARRTSFETLYDSPAGGSVQAPILRELRSREMQLCPGCGEDGTPNTLDHYLPKSRYPHFSITPANLFPLCDICQGHKGTETVDAAGDRRALHPYFDEFLIDQAVALTIEPPFETPTFTLAPHGNLNPEERALVTRHMGLLKIEERYGHFFRTEHLRMLRLVDVVRKKNGSVPESISMFKLHAELRAVNGWSHIFWAAVAADADLLNWLENEDLPDYL